MTYEINQQKIGAINCNKIFPSISKDLSVSFYKLLIEHTYIYILIYL